MDQYPDHAGLDSNYSYNFGIFATCQPDDEYMRAYDAETRYIRQEDCKGCTGCDASPSEGDAKPKIISDKKESFNNKLVPSNSHSTSIIPKQELSYPLMHYPVNDNKNDEKYNIVIIVLLASIVLILLMNNNKKPQYIYLPTTNTNTLPLPFPLT